ncbi:MAG: threonine synthase [Bacteroidales bacterium]|nr:threonine synthase [Bacteroidales bacterium]
MITEKFIYKCVDCGKEYSANDVMYLCPACAEKNTPDKPPKGVLKVIYDYSGILKRASQNVFDKLKETKFIDLLPINNVKNLPELRVGETPLYKQTELNGKKLSFNLFLKDDSQNPTYSFKDRASYLVSAYAKENGIDTIVAASTGNAGSSLAGICASQNQKAIIMVPEAARSAKLTQIVMYGAVIIPVKGTYDDAFDLSIKATEKFGWYNRNTAFNPLTIEGKKTVSFELFDQLNQTIPDRIFVPVGDGVIISGVYKGFEDLLKLGIINKMPVIVAVQSKGSDNLSRNIDNEDFEIKPSKTIADSISVDIPRNFYMAKQFIQKYEGEYLSVSDEEILSASKELSKNTGLFAEPAAATAFAGLLNYMNNNKIEKNSNNVVLLTGSGLKDLKSVQSVISIPKAVEPDVENLGKLP